MAEKTYIATEPLYVGTARAHNPGDVVPADNVERNGWQDGVVGEGTKAAKAAQESARAAEPQAVSDQ
jgi:hypothetical protein